MRVAILTLLLALVFAALSSSVVDAGVLFGSYTPSGKNPSLWDAMTAWFREGHRQSNLRQAIRVVEIGWAPTDKIASQMNEILEAWTFSNAVPVITWMPYPYKTWTSPTPNDDIVNGKYDDYIDAFLGNLSKAYVFERSSFNRTAYLRFAPSPNGNWFPWSPSCPPCGNTGQKIDQTSASYQRMWNYIVGKVRSPKYNLNEDVIQLMFDVSAVDETGKVTDFAPTSFSDYDKRPNWFSITGINWGNSLPGNSWTNVTELFSPAMKTLWGLNSSLPMAVVSAGSSSVPNGVAAKNDWLKDLCEFSKKYLRMVSYHNADSSTDVAVFGGEKGYRNYSTPYSADNYTEYPAWRECVTQPMFIGSNYSSYGQLLNQTDFKGQNNY